MHRHEISIFGVVTSPHKDDLRCVHNILVGQHWVRVDRSLHACWNNCFSIKQLFLAGIFIENLVAQVHGKRVFHVLLYSVLILSLSLLRDFEVELEGDRADDRFSVATPIFGLILKVALSASLILVLRGWAFVADLLRLGVVHIGELVEFSHLLVLLRVERVVAYLLFQLQMVVLHGQVLVYLALIFVVLQLLEVPSFVRMLLAHLR